MAVRVFARMMGATVFEVVREHVDITTEWHQDFLASCIEITGTIPEPKAGWVRQGDNFTEPGPFVPGPADQAALAIAAGCQIVSTGTPAHSATYAATGPDWQNMRDVALYIASFDAFPEGSPVLYWTTRSGDVAFTTTIQFKAVARGVSDWLMGWQRYSRGKAPSPPTSPVTIP